MGKIYTFREVTDKEELEKCFLLRYKVYSESANKVFINENIDKIDVDFYDVHARHYCLQVDEIIAGYLRVVLPKEDITNETVFGIGEKYSWFERADYFHQNLIEKKEKLTEASRLIILPEFSSIKVSRHLVECAVVLYVLICIGQSHAIINCLEEHAAFYESYGFIPVANGEKYFLNGMNRMCLSLSLSLSLSSVPKQYHERFEAMAAEYRSTGKIVKEL